MDMNRSLLLLILVVTASIPAVASARDTELIGDRPDFTESAATIAPGRVQIEAGVTGTDAGGADVLEAGEILARIGLDARTELRVGLGSWVRIEDGATDLDGLDDLELGFKRHLLAGEGATPELALIVATTLPTGGADIGADDLQPLAVLAGEWTLSERVGLGTNLGWTRAHDGERFSSLWVSAAFGIALGERAGLFLEGFAFDKEAPGGDAAGYGDAGLTYLIAPDLQLDVRVGTGFDGGSDDFVGAGLVLRI